MSNNTSNNTSRRTPALIEGGEYVREIRINKNDVVDAINKLGNNYSGYDGDFIDDYQEYNHKDGIKIIEIMTPIGDYLYFKTTPEKDDIVHVRLIACSHLKVSNI